MSMAPRRAGRIAIAAACLYVWAAASTSVAFGRVAPPEDSVETRSVADGVYTREQAERGKSVYSEQCALCHRDDLSGDPLYNPGPELAGDTFRIRWDGRPIDDLFVFIKDTMPYQDPGHLTPREAADLVAYILQENKYPAGAQELSIERTDLRDIRIVAMRKP